MSTAEFDNVTELDVQNLRALVELQRAHFRAEGEVSHATRVDRLKRLKALIVENKTSFASTTKREYGNARSYEFSLFSEYASKVEAIDYSIKHLKDWMKPVSRKTNTPMNLLVEEPSEILPKRRRWHHFNMESALRAHGSAID